MPMHDNDHVRIDGAFVVWDGITRPEAKDDGGFRWNVKIVAPPNHPDVALLQQVADAELLAGDFRGTLPNGGMMPVGIAGPTEFNGLYPGWSVVNCSTYRAPQVFDEAGAPLDAMQYGALMYGGQKVNVLVHCKTYNNVSKGVAARLDGFAIVASAQAVRHEFGGVDARAAFGGPAPAAPAAGPAAAPAAAPAMPAQATDFMPPAPPGAAAPPPPAPPAPAAPATYLVNGQQFTAEQLINSGWTPEQVAAL